MASELRVNTLKDASGNNSVATSTVAQGSAKAWADVDMTGTATLDDSFNISGLTDNGTGDFTLAIDSDMASANYCVSVAYNTQSANKADLKVDDESNKTSSSIEMRKMEDGSATDADVNLVTIHGDLA